MRRLKAPNAFIPVIVAFSAWEVASRVGLKEAILLPPPSDLLWTFLWLLKGKEFLWALVKSSLRVLIGLSLGASVGFAFGVLMGLKETLDRWLSPIFSLLYPIPSLGWLPLLLIWLGPGEGLSVALIFICSMFPVLYNTLTGIRGVPRELLYASKVLGASPLRTLKEVLLPLALPQILTGLRLEAGMAWRVLLAAEMIAIPTGIGALMWKAESLMRVDVILVCLGVLSFLCFAFERSFLWLERRFTRWR